MFSITWIDVDCNDRVRYADSMAEVAIAIKELANEGGNGYFRIWVPLELKG